MTATPSAYAWVKVRIDREPGDLVIERERYQRDPETVAVTHQTVQIDDAGREHTSASGRRKTASGWHAGTATGLYSDDAHAWDDIDDVVLDAAIEAAERLLDDLRRRRLRAVRGIPAAAPAAPRDDDAGRSVVEFLVFVVLLVGLVIVGGAAVLNGLAEQTCERSPAACSLVEDGATP